MKKLCLLVLLNFLVFNSFAQNKEHKEYFDDERIKEIGFFDENGIKTGEWKTFHENGQLKEIGNYLDGTKIAEWKSYHENGQLKKHGNILDGLKIEKWKYYDENGKLQSEDEQLKHEIEDIKINDPVDAEEELVAYWGVVENFAIYPGCDKGKEYEKRQCMSKKISAFVGENFNAKIAKEVGLSGKQRISVIFKFDTKGNIVNIRSRASHPILEQEAIRVINLLPKMKPATHKGKAVVVPYSLPIIFQVQE